MAIRGFTDALRAELINEGLPIRITMVDLPAVNTPQFDWARVHLRHAPRPLGKPIEPEVVAEAVFRAAEGRWREYSLGIPTIIAILGNMVARIPRPVFCAHHNYRPAERGNSRPGAARQS